MLRSPLLLSTRADHRAGLVRAVYRMDDGSEVWEVGTLSLALTNSIPGLFEAWLKVLTDALSTLHEQALGQKPARVDVIPVADMN